MVPRKQPLLLRRAVGLRGSLRGCRPLMDGVVVSRDAQSPHAVLKVLSPPIHLPVALLHLSPPTRIKKEATGLNKFSLKFK